MNSSAKQKPTGVYTTIQGLLDLRHLADGLTLESNKRSGAILDGNTRSAFRGRGMDFAEVRPYQAGDDVRNIDWRVTARTQKPYTKLFEEERERPVFLVVDQRSSMFFGTRTQFKSVLAASIAGVIGWTALANNDRIGAMIFNDNEQIDIRAQRGKKAQLGLVHALNDANNALNSPISEKPISLSEILNEVMRVAKPGSSIFVLSDFNDFNDQCVEALAKLSRHTDTTLLHIFDEMEVNAPAKAMTLSNGSQRIESASLNKTALSRFQASFYQQVAQINQTCARTRIRFASIKTEQPIADTVNAIFRHKRNAKGGAGPTSLGDGKS